VGGRVAVGTRGVSVAEMGVGVGEEQETRRIMQKAKGRRRVEVCMDGF